jgi:hypothetical protein
MLLHPVLLLSSLLPTASLSRQSSALGFSDSSNGFLSLLPNCRRYKIPLDLAKAVANLV